MDLSHSDWIMRGGAASLGFLIGAFGAFLVEQENDRNNAILQGATAVVDGVCVIAVFHKLTAPHGAVREYWFYPAGLATGLVVGLLYNWFTLPRPRR
jgi:hypothetical protein